MGIAARVLSVAHITPHSFLCSVSLFRSFAPGWACKVPAAGSARESILVAAVGAQFCEPNARFARHGRDWRAWATLSSLSCLSFPRMRYSAAASAG